MIWGHPKPPVPRSFPGQTTSPGRLEHQCRFVTSAGFGNAAPNPMLCHLASNPPLSCVVYIPHVDGVFVRALLVLALLNGGATLLSTVALKKADASLVNPLLTFNPSFTLLIALFLLGEVPGWQKRLEWQSCSLGVSA